MAAKGGLGIGLSALFDDNTPIQRRRRRCVYLKLSRTGRSPEKNLTTNQYPHWRIR